MHIPDDPLFNEKYYFTPGDAAPDDRDRRRRRTQASGFRVWKTRYANIGVLICWDQWYPEAARITSLLGADMLFYPTAIGWHPAEKAEWGAAQVDAWRTMQRAHAIANGVFVASPNRVGHEDEPGTNGIEFFGHSFIADPFGRIIAEAGHRSGRSSSRRAIRADRGHAPQLAVPARPPHRRVRADPQPLPRRSKRRHRPRTGLPARVGAARAPPGSRGRITSPTGRASSRRFRGSTRRSRACSPRTSASRFSATTTT